MLDTLTAFVISIAPWGLGVLMLYALFFRRGQWRLEHHLFMIGAAVYIGYVWIALVMAGLQFFTLPVFSGWLLFCITASILAAMVLGLAVRLNDLQPSHGENFAHSAQKPSTTAFERLTEATMMVWLLLISAPTLWEVAFRPAVAWDTMSFWADHGASFLIAQLDNKTSITMSNQIHPATIKYVGAWAAFSAYERSADWLYLPWAALYCGLTLTTIGFGKLLSGKWWLGLIVAVVMASSPVIQAHTSLSGYADLWLAYGLFLILTLLSTTAQRKFKPISVYAAMTCMTLISLLFLKGNAVAYLMIFLSASLLAWALTRRHWAVVAALIGFCALTLLWGFSNGIDWSIGGYRITFLPEEGWIALGQRKTMLANNSWLQIITNFWHALIINSSFYLVGILWLALFCLSLMNNDVRSNWETVTAILLLLGIVGFLATAQNFSKGQFFIHSFPTSDTGLSRFLQLAYSIAMFLFLAVTSLKITNAKINPNRTHISCI